MPIVSLFDERHLGKKHLFTYKGLTGAYYLTGDQTARPVIFLHGLTGNHIGLLPIAAHLSRYKCILLDLPGHGETPIPPDDMNMNHLADWLMEFIKQWEAAVLITHSYAGSLSMLALSRQPESVVGCILLNPVASISTLARAYRNVAGLLRPSLSAALNDIIPLRHRRHLYLLERSDPQVITVMEQLNDAESILTTSREQMAYFQKLGDFFDEPAIFGGVPKALAQRTYCVVGTRDPIVAGDNNAVLMKVFGASHVVVCEESGHLMPVEAFDDTAKIVNKILKRIAKPTAFFKRRLARKP